MNLILFWPCFIVIIVLIFVFYSKTIQKKSACTKDFKNYDCEIAIVGSGILGSALATVLSREGRKVIIIEKDLKQPDKIIGEFLQPGGCRALNELGLGDCLENIDAQQLHGYVIHDHNEDSVDVSFPMDLEDVKGGKAFVHGRFVQALRERARNEKNVTYMEGNVIKMIENEKTQAVEGVVYKDKNNDREQKITAKLVVVADGCFSRLRKNLVKEQPRVVSTFVGLELRNCTQIKRNFAELVLSDPSPILIYQISSNVTRMLIDVKAPNLPRDIKSYLKDKLYHQLPDHLRDPFIRAVEQGPIKSMPNNFLPPSPIFRKGAMALGDALNMRHPISGGGMTVAFRDVVMFRDLVKQIDDLSDYDSAIKLHKTLHIRRKANYSFVVNILSMALYELFAAENESLYQLKKACFEYFKLGGECVRGPVGLLSVLKPSPFLLLYHFFSVAVYAVYFSFKSHSLLKLHRCFYDSICIWSKACSILFPLVWSEMKTYNTVF